MIFRKKLKLLINYLIFKKIFKINEIRIILPLILLIIFFGLLKPAFLSVKNLQSIVGAASFHGIIVLGMTYSFIVRRPDLSIGSTAGLSAIIAGISMAWFGLPIWLGITIALLVSMIIGLINGILTVKLQIPPIVATLGMLFILRGFAYVLCGGIIVYPLPDITIEFVKLKLLGFPISFIIFLILAIIFDFILRKTTFGRKVYATGADVRVARLMGINTNLIRIMMHIQLGIFSAIGGILYMFNMGNASPNIGVGWEFPVIVGVVIGGVSLLGGIGTVLGAFFGILIVQTLYNGLTIIGLKGIYENIAIGFVILIIVIIDAWKRTRMVKKKL